LGQHYLAGLGPLGLLSYV